MGSLIQETLEDFIIASNKIEGESTYIDRELPIYQWWLKQPLTERNMKTFHSGLAKARKQIEPRYCGVYRDCSVWIAGQEISAQGIDGKMWDFFHDFIHGTPYENHKYFEKIHPFIDLNGRVGRAIWLHHMLDKKNNVSLGFLHAWYYQSLAECRIYSCGSVLNTYRHANK